MSQIQPIGVDEAARARRFRSACSDADARARRALAALPLWLRLLLRNPKSCSGLILLGGMVAVAVFAPLIATHDPTAYSLLDAQAVALVASLLRHDRSGHRRLLAGRARHALVALPRLRPRPRSRPCWRRRLGILAAYCGGWVDDDHQLRDQRLPRDPHDPAADRRLGLHQEPRHRRSMILILGLTLWAFEARILRGQALHAAQPRLHARRQGGRRADLAHRVRAS